jgi:hypothetical protein
MTDKGEIMLPGGGSEPEGYTIKGIPPAVMQAIYHEATQRSEKLTKSYRDAFVVERSDIEHLAHGLNKLLSSMTSPALQKSSS